MIDRGAAVSTRRRVNRTISISQSTVSVLHSAPPPPLLHSSTTPSMAERRREERKRGKGEGKRKGGNIGEESGKGKREKGEKDGEEGAA